MRTAFGYIFLTVLAALMAFSEVQAQEISGFSTMGAVSVCTGIGCTRKNGAKTLVAEEAAYMATEEDYTASLYYDVSSVSAMYYAGSSGALTSASITGNPTAATTYYYDNAVLPGTVATSRTIPGIAPAGPTTFIDDITPGIYTEATDHVVDFFYVTSLGEYYDPYGYSVVNGDGGDYDSGYWYSVTVYGTYIEEASVILGESYDSSTNSGNSSLQGPSITTASYQAFIPPAWIQGPPAASCPVLQEVIYAGDNRGFDPEIESYRILQAISMGIGGLTSVYPANAPPVDETGWTYQFSSAVLQNNQIPASAYNWNYLGACSSLGVNNLGHEPTTGFVSPGVIYNGTNSTQTTFRGSGTNPIPIFAFPISWNIPLTLTEPSTTDLHVTGTLSSTCYPAHEVSVAGTDLSGGTWMPSSSSLVYVTACLSGVVSVNQSISQDITLTSPSGGVL